MTLVSADSLCSARGADRWRAHATCVALGDHGLLILGKSGTGKSSLACEMLALGCALVCDDAVEIWIGPDGDVMCGPPENAPEKLEIRGFGLLPIPLKTSAKLMSCLMLSQDAGPRFPPEENVAFGSYDIPIYRTRYAVGLAAKAVLLLRQGGQTLRA